MDLLAKLNQKQAVTPAEIAGTIVEPTPPPAFQALQPTSLEDKIAQSGESWTMGGIGNLVVDNHKAGALVNDETPTPGLPPSPPPQVTSPAPVPIPHEVTPNAPSPLQLAAIQMGSEDAPMPEDATEAFSLLIAQLSQFLDADSDGIEKALERVILHTNDHPELRDNVQPEDVHVISGALRKLTGRVIEKKQANKSRSAAKQVIDAEVAGVMASIQL